MIQAHNSPAFLKGQGFGLTKLREMSIERYRDALQVMRQCRCQEGTPMAAYWKDFVAGMEYATTHPHIHAADESARPDPVLRLAA